MTTPMSASLKVVALGGGHGLAASLTAPDLATHFPRGRDIEVPYSHFIPMEAPEVIAEFIRAPGPR